MRALYVIFVVFLIGFFACKFEQKEERRVQVGDVIYTHFSLSLIDGTRLDGSRHLHSKAVEGQPLKYKVGSQQVIRGWDEGVLGMKKGEIRKIIIPPNMGYGEKGARDNIQPSDTLLLEVSLMDWARK